LFFIFVVGVMEARQRDLAEIACSEAIADVLNAIASKTRVSAFNLAVRVPGACHDHPPTKNTVPGCAYCARCGNVFSGDVGNESKDDDIVAPYVAQIASALENLQREVRATLDAGGVKKKVEADVEFDDLDEALFRAMTEEMM
jgi:hypothetical protein